MVLLKDGLELELLRKSSPLASDGKDTVILKNERRSVTFCCTVNVHTVNYLTIYEQRKEVSSFTTFFHLCI